MLKVFGEIRASGHSGIQSAPIQNYYSSLEKVERAISAVFFSPRYTKEQTSTALDLIAVKRFHLKFINSFH